MGTGGSAVCSFLFETSATGDLTPWFSFFLHGVAELAAAAERKAEELVDLMEALRNELPEARVPVTTIHLAEHLLEHPYLDTNLAREMLDVSRPTAQKAIDNRPRPAMRCNLL